MAFILYTLPIFFRIFINFQSMVCEWLHRSSQLRGAVFHINTSNGFIYRHSCLILISLETGQNWHFPSHSPFSFRHMLQHTLIQVSVELLLRCRTMHSWMASCPPNGMKKNHADKRTSIAKGKFSNLWHLSHSVEIPRLSPVKEETMWLGGEWQFPIYK